MEEAYVHLIDMVSPVEVESRMAGIIEDDDYWDMGDNPASKDADMRASLCFRFVAIQSTGGKMNIQVPDKAGDVVGLFLQSLENLYRQWKRRRRQWWHQRRNEWSCWGKAVFWRIMKVNLRV